MKKIILYIIIALSFGTLKAQTIENAEPNLGLNSIAFVPHYLIFKGLRIDYERKIASNQWLVIAPQLFVDEQLEESGSDIIEEDGYYETLFGYGVNINHQFTIVKSETTLLYAGYGIGLHHFEMEFPLETWYPVTVNGLEYLSYETQLFKENIDRYEGNLLMGFKSYPYPNFFMEGYIGATLKKSMTSNEKDMETYKFDDRTWSYGYTGTGMLLGFKMGFVF